MCYTRRMVKIATWPARFVLGLAMDLAFGKAENCDYVSMTSAR